MVSSTIHKNSKVAIYGMGLTGCSAALTLKKLGIQIFCWDDDIKIREKVKNLNFPIKKFWGRKNHIDKVVISPGIDIRKCKIKNYLNENKKKIITDLDIFFALNKKSLIISITGTNGKSTTCKIIEKILKEAKYKVKTVGNIGKPILTLNKKEKKSIIILEVSSYQLQYSKIFRSKHAAILNISSDHLDRHKNMKNYINVKSKIFFSQNSSDYSYVNLNNKYSKTIMKILKKKKIKSKIVTINDLSFSLIIKKIKNTYFNNKGNFENVAFAYKIAKNLKIKNEIIIKSLNKFKGLPHRQEVIFSDKNFLCINDSKATSFDASLQSLSNFNKIYWIVGGAPKHKDIFHLKKVKNKIIKAYIVGKNVEFFKKQIKESIPFSISNNIKTAINQILKDFKHGDQSKKTILFSPAAASFDQFNNFEIRGNYFKNLIIKKISNV